MTGGAVTTAVDAAVGAGVVPALLHAPSTRANAVVMAIKRNG